MGPESTVPMHPQPRPSNHQLLLNFRAIFPPNGPSISLSAGFTKFKVIWPSPGTLGELLQAQAGRRHGSAHASRSVVGLRSRRGPASKYSEILTIARPLFFGLFHQRSNFQKKWRERIVTIDSKRKKSHLSTLRP